MRNFQIKWLKQMCDNEYEGRISMGRASLYYPLVGHLGQSLSKMIYFFLNQRDYIPHEWLMTSCFKCFETQISELSAGVGREFDDKTRMFASTVLFDSLRPVYHMNRTEVF